jgi:formyl-CoA transferase
MMGHGAAPSRLVFVAGDPDRAGENVRQGAILGTRLPGMLHRLTRKLGRNLHMATHRLPLNGFKVIDLTAHRAGPTAVRQLADWGADVIKIEAPGPAVDATGSRRDGPDFQNLHRNKRSLTLNLKSPEGLKIFFELVKDADVVVENYKSTVKHRLGVDYEAVKKVNPRIVYGSISGFGQDGPYEGRAGVDQIAQGMGGLMTITGHPGGGPVRVGIAINDTSSGILLANAIVLALLDRERTGEGQWVATSLIEAQIFMLDFQASRYLIKGEVAGQEGNSHPTSSGTGMFQTSDGYINIAASGDSLWRNFCKAAGAEHLLSNPDFATPASRSKNRKHLAELLTGIIRQHTNDYWIDLMLKAGVPCGPINTIDKVFDDPQVKHLGIARPINHPKYGKQTVVGQPIHMSKYPQPDTLKHTPEPGEHTEEVLGALGYDKKAIEGLRAKGAI